MESLANLTITELLKKAEIGERMRIIHKKNVNDYRLKNLEHWQENARRYAKNNYWKKKGFLINDLGEKIPIKKEEPISV